MTRGLCADIFAFRALARISVAAAGLAAMFAAAPAGAAGTMDPHGLWLRAEGGVQFSFYDCGALLCAKVVGVRNPEDRASIGTVILRGASKTGPNEWRGKLYNSDDGKIYDGIITVTSVSELTLKGCILGILCGGETWTRVNAAAAAPRPQNQAMAKQLQ